MIVILLLEALHGSAWPGPRAKHGSCCAPDPPSWAAGNSGMGNFKFRGLRLEMAWNFFTDA